MINRRLIGDYVTCWEEFEPLDGAVEAIASLNQAGLRTVVVTNQRGIAIGRMTRDAVDQVHERLSGLVRNAGGQLDEFYICPHDRHVGCGCRKPAPGLLDQANQHEAVDWSRSYLIGDNDTDILAGKARNVFTIKVAGPSEVEPDKEVSNLPEAADLILSVLRL